MTEFNTQQISVITMLKNHNSSKEKPKIVSLQRTATGIKIRIGAFRTSKGQRRKLLFDKTPCLKIHLVKTGNNDGDFLSEGENR